MEQQLATPNPDQYDQPSDRGKERRAIDKINDLSASLRRSEELRKETVDLLEIAQNQVQESPDVTKDPRYQELEPRSRSFQINLRSSQIKIWLNRKSYETFRMSCVRFNKIY